MKAGDQIEVLDRSDELLGWFALSEEKYGAWCGLFRPGPAFESVRPLFEEFASLVNSQSLAYLEPVEEKIAMLGARGRFGGTTFPMIDLQIYDDAASFRTTTPPEK